MLKASDPKDVTNKFLKQKSVTKNACKKLQTLHAIPKGRFKKLHQQEYDKLLQFITMTR